MIMPIIKLEICFDKSVDKLRHKNEAVTLTHSEAFNSFMTRVPII